MCKPILDKGSLKLINIFENAGYEAYAVGGCVRASLMRRPVSDIDIAVSAPPSLSERLLEEQGIRFFETGIKHGTVTALVDGVTYELTTFRTDGEYSDNRRPDSVTFVTDLREDLSRRDFTVNAIAYSPRTGIVDPFGGTEDIEHRTLRAVGDPEKRFSEDALRILRGVRFSSTLDFTIEKATAAAMLEKSPLLKNVARERVTVELFKLLEGVAAPRALRENSGVLPHVHPALASPDENAFSALEKLPRTATVRLAALLFFAPADDLYDLRLSREQKHDVSFYVSNVSSPLPADPAEVRLCLCNWGAERLYGLCRLRRAIFGDDPSLVISEAESVISEGKPYRVCDLAVSGTDLVALGVKGAQIGAVLAGLLRLVVREEIPNEKEALLAYVKSR